MTEQQDDWVSQMTLQLREYVINKLAKMDLDVANIEVIPNRQAVARYIRDALDLQPVDIARAIETLVHTRAIGQGIDPATAMFRVIIGTTGATITPAAVETAKSEELNDLATRAAREGAAKLSFVQVLILVIAFILLIGLPVMQQELQLPPEAQNIISGEVGTVALALAIAQTITQKRK